MNNRHVSTEEDVQWLEEWPPLTEEQEALVNRVSERIIKVMSGFTIHKDEDGIIHKVLKGGV